MNKFMKRVIGAAVLSSLLLTTSASVGVLQKVYAADATYNMKDKSFTVEQNGNLERGKEVTVTLGFPNGRFDKAFFQLDYDKEILALSSQNGDVAYDNAAVDLDYDDNAGWGNLTNLDNTKTYNKLVTLTFHVRKNAAKTDVKVNFQPVYNKKEYYFTESWKTVSFTGTAGSPTQKEFIIESAHGNDLKAHVNGTTIIPLRVTKNIGITNVEMVITVGDTDIETSYNLTQGAIDKSIAISKDSIENMNDQRTGGWLSTDPEDFKRFGVIALVMNKNTNYEGDLINLNLKIPESKKSEIGNKFQVKYKLVKVYDAYGVEMNIDDTEKTINLEFAKEIEYGDVDMDGDVDTQDAFIMWQAVNEEITLNDEQLRLANVGWLLSSSGTFDPDRRKVDTRDVLAVIKRISQNKDSWPDSAGTWN